MPRNTYDTLQGNNTIGVLKGDTLTFTGITNTGAILDDVSFIRATRRSGNRPGAAARTGALCRKDLLKTKLLKALHRNVNMLFYECVDQFNTRNSSWKATLFPAHQRRTFWPGHPMTIRSTAKRAMTS
jgi:hypothetical protein